MGLRPGSWNGPWKAEAGDSPRDWEGGGGGEGLSKVTQCLKSGIGCEPRHFSFLFESDVFASHCQTIGKRRWEH